MAKVEIKKPVVDEISEKIKNAQAVVLVDYRGLTVAQDTELRKQLRAEGFCYGLKVPLIAVNSLETMKEPFLGQNYDVIIPLIDARRMEVYCAVFDGNSGEMLTETEAKILDEQSFKELEGKKILFVGDGAKKAQEILQISGADFNENVYPSAKYLIKKSVEKFNRQDFEDVAYFEPFYLKDFHGVKKKS